MGGRQRVGEGQDPKVGHLGQDQELERDRAHAEGPHGPTYGLLLSVANIFPNIVPV